MKKTAWLVVIVTALAVACPMRAQAINKEWSAVLGFLGGVLVANASCPQTTTVVREPVIVERPVVVEQPVIRREIIIEEPEPRGHYEYREERVWVSGRWITTGRGRCRTRVWEPGHYRMQMVKVWVPARRSHRRRRCR